METNLGRVPHILNELINNVIVVVDDVDVAALTPFHTIFTLAGKHRIEIVYEIISTGIVEKVI